MGIFELVNLALIYSRNATPEVGYRRAKLFSREFSRYFHLDIEPPELESFPLTKISKKLTDSVKTLHLISKIDAETAKYYKQ